CRSSWGLSRTTGKEPRMKSMLTDEIHEALREYLEGRVPLREFEDWFVSRTWNVRQFDDPSLNDLVYEIELRLAEYTNGHRTEGELRALLQPLSPLVAGYTK